MGIMINREMVRRDPALRASRTHEAPYSIYGNLRHMNGIVLKLSRTRQAPVLS